MEDQLIINDATKRSIIRWIRIVFSIPILGYIYSPFEEIPKCAVRVRFAVVPVMLLSGFWMWKGHLLLFRRDRPNKTLQRNAVGMAVSCQSQRKRVEVGLEAGVDVGKSRNHPRQNSIR
jgi:hypothetical protein